MQHVKTIEFYNPRTKYNVLIVFDDMIYDTISHKKINPITTELLYRGRILKIFVTETYFQATKDTRLFTFFKMKILSKRELHQSSFNHSSNYNFIEFMIFYKKCAAKPYFFSDWYYSCLRQSLTFYAGL